MSRRPKVPFLDITVNRRLTPEQKMALASGLFETILRTTGHCGACTADVLALIVGMHAQTLNEGEDFNEEECQRAFQAVVEVLRKERSVPVGVMVISALLQALGHDSEEEKTKEKDSASPSIH